MMVSEIQMTPSTPIVEVTSRRSSSAYKRPRPHQGRSPSPSVSSSKGSISGSANGSRGSPASTPGTRGILEHRPKFTPSSARGQSNDRNSIGGKMTSPRRLTNGKSMQPPTLDTKVGGRSHSVEGLRGAGGSRHSSPMQASTSERLNGGRRTKKSRLSQDSNHTSPRRPSVTPSRLASKNATPPTALRRPHNDTVTLGARLESPSAEASTSTLWSTVRDSAAPPVINTSLKRRSTNTPERQRPSKRSRPSYAKPVVFVDISSDSDDGSDANKPYRPDAGKEPYLPARLRRAHSSDDEPLPVYGPQTSPEKRSLSPAKKRSRHQSEAENIQASETPTSTGENGGKAAAKSSNGTPNQTLPIEQKAIPGAASSPFVKLKTDALMGDQSTQAVQVSTSAVQRMATSAGIHGESRRIPAAVATTSATSSQSRSATSALVGTKSDSGSSMFQPYSTAQSYSMTDRKIGATGPFKVASIAVASPVMKASGPTLSTTSSIGQTTNSPQIQRPQGMSSTTASRPPTPHVHSTASSSTNRPAPASLAAASPVSGDSQPAKPARSTASVQNAASGTSRIHLSSRDTPSSSARPIISHPQTANTASTSAVASSSTFADAGISGYPAEQNAKQGAARNLSPKDAAHVPPAMSTHSPATVIPGSSSRVESPQTSTAPVRPATPSGLRATSGDYLSALSARQRSNELARAMRSPFGSGHGFPVSESRGNSFQTSDSRREYSPLSFLGMIRGPDLEKRDRPSASEGPPTNANAQRTMPASSSGGSFNSATHNQLNMTFTGWSPDIVWNRETTSFERSPARLINGQVKRTESSFPQRSSPANTTQPQATVRTDAGGSSTRDTIAKPSPTPRTSSPASRLPRPATPSILNRISNDAKDSPVVLTAKSTANTHQQDGRPLRPLAPSIPSPASTPVSAATTSPFHPIARNGGKNAETTTHELASTTSLASAQRYTLSGNPTTKEIYKLSPGLSPFAINRSTSAQTPPSKDAKISDPKPFSRNESTPSLTGFLGAQNNPQSDLKGQSPSAKPVSHTVPSSSFKVSSPLEVQTSRQRQTDLSVSASVLPAQTSIASHSIGARFPTQESSLALARSVPPPNHNAPFAAGGNPYSLSQSIVRSITPLSRAQMLAAGGSITENAGTSTLSPTKPGPSGPLPPSALWNFQVTEPLIPVIQHVVDVRKDKPTTFNHTIRSKVDREYSTRHKSKDLIPQMKWRSELNPEYLLLLQTVNDLTVPRFASTPHAAGKVPFLRRNIRAGLKGVTAHCYPDVSRLAKVEKAVIQSRKGDRYMDLGKDQFQEWMHYKPMRTRVWNTQATSIFERRKEEETQLLRARIRHVLRFKMSQIKLLDRSTGQEIDLKEFSSPGGPVIADLVVGALIGSSRSDRVSSMQWRNIGIKNLNLELPIDEILLGLKKEEYAGGITIVLRNFYDCHGKSWPFAPNNSKVLQWHATIPVFRKIDGIDTYIQEFPPIRLTMKDEKPSVSQIQMDLGEALSWELDYRQPIRPQLKLKPRPIGDKVKVYYHVIEDTKRPLPETVDWTRVPIGWSCAFCSLGDLGGEEELHTHFGVTHRDECRVDEIRRESSDGTLLLTLRIRVGKAIHEVAEKPYAASKKVQASVVSAPAGMVALEPAIAVESITEPALNSVLEEERQQVIVTEKKIDAALSMIADDGIPTAAELAALPTPVSMMQQSDDSMSVDTIPGPSIVDLPDTFANTTSDIAEMELPSADDPAVLQNPLGLAQPQMVDRKNQYTNWSYRVAPGTLADLMPELDKIYDGGKFRYYMRDIEESHIWMWDHLTDKRRFLCCCWNRWREEKGPMRTLGQTAYLKGWLDSYAPIMRRADIEVEVKDMIYLLFHHYLIEREQLVEVCQYWDRLARAERKAKGQMTEDDIWEEEAERDAEQVANQRCTC